MRLLIGLLLAAILVPAIFVLPSWGMLILATAIVLLGLHEFVGLARVATSPGPFWVLYLAVPAVVVLLALEPLEHTQLLVTAIIAVLPWAAVLAARMPLTAGAAAAGLLGIALPYFAAPAASVYLLHGRGPWLVFLLAAIVAINDSMAYYTGRLLGRHLMAPRVSPKKTWEGALGGLVGALVAAGVWSFARHRAVDPELLLWAGVTAVAAQLGDLAESLLKRSVGVKDSGRLLPGHGGVLDRIDAFLLAAPVLYLGVELLGLRP